jgi:hypothetical protein
MSAALTLAPRGPNAEAIERAIVDGDLSSLTPAQRVEYYNATCKSLGLNPLTRPFRYLRLNGALVLYTTRDCTDQLRKRDAISVELGAATVADGIYIQRARASTPDGRHDESTGAVPFESLKGEARANAVMKAETKAKRRVTLSICGLSFPDESEVDAIPGAHRIEVDPQTGEIHESPQLPAKEVGPGVAAADAMRAKQAEDAAMLYRLRAEEITQAQDLDALKGVWKKVSADGKAHRLGIEQCAQLTGLKDARKFVLESDAKAARAGEEERAMDVGDDPGGLGPEP